MEDYKFYAYLPIGSTEDNKLASVAALTPINQVIFLRNCLLQSIPVVEVSQNDARRLLQRQNGVGAGVYLGATENSFLEASRRLLAKLKLGEVVAISERLEIAPPLKL